MKINIYKFNETDIYYRVKTVLNLNQITNQNFHNNQDIINNSEQIIFNLFDIYKTEGHDLFENIFSGFSMSVNEYSEEIDLILVSASSEEMVEGIRRMLDFQIDCWDDQFNRDTNIPDCNFPKIPVWEEAEYSLIMDRCEEGDTVARNALVTLGELVVKGGYYLPRKIAA